MNLEKMTEIDFRDYIGHAIEEYAKANVKAGTWSETESTERSKETFEHLLPDNEKTEQHYLYKIMEKEIKVGYIWIHKMQALSDNTGFIFDFYIFDEFRGKGYGKKTMEAIEDEARKLAIHKISLHVFAYNEAAIALYKKMGYKTTDLHMAKIIDPY